MHDHPSFPGLRLHDDAELSRILGSAIIVRRVVHEWPLTRTEELRLADGRHLAYKVQLPPSVEPAFYAAARSPLLTPHLDLGADGASRFLATEWVESPTLGALERDPATTLRIARAVADAIAEIEGELPLTLDLSTTRLWEGVTREVAAKLRSLIEAGRFGAIPVADVDRMLSWSRLPSVVAAATTDAAPVHGDLTPDEVFVLDDGAYRVIDWQRPLRGPRELDVVSLLRFSGIDPALHVAPEFVQLSWFLLLHWAVAAAHDILPDLPPALPESWAVEALGRLP